jgi:molybdate-binding protein/DNA-binding XRE family transcriptional regulator
MIRSNIRERRVERAWSQEALARAAGLPRPTVSAIETGRIVPSVAAALSLAAALECSVEDLFAADGAKGRSTPDWAWSSEVYTSAYWEAEVGNRRLLYPCERTSAGFLPPDGIVRGGRLEPLRQTDPRSTLVLAGCDPAVGLLAADITGGAPMRVLSLVRSSGRALELLRLGVVHLAGVHLQQSRSRHENRETVRRLLGPGYTLLRVASWQEGVALQSGLGVATIRSAVGANLRWVGREKGSGARRCLDAIVGRRRRPRGYDRIAFDHTAVAETIRTGWAQAGVCVRLAAVSAGIDFLPFREEDYDLCCRTDMERDPRVQALLRVLRSRRYRRSLAELPGYDSSTTGTVERVAR